MSDMERDARRIGGHIWPDPRAVLGRIGGGPPPQRSPRGSRGLIAAVVTGVALVAVLVASLALRSNGGSSPSGATAAVPPSASASSLPTTGPATPTATSATSAPAEASASPVIAPPPSRPAPTHTPTPAPSPTPRNSPAPGNVTLTNSSSGTSITVHAGTTIVVNLTVTSGYRWTEPDSSNAAAVSRSSGSTGSDGSATATFLATASGSADLSAVDNPNCYPQCLPPSRLWRVTVTVVP